MTSTRRSIILLEQAGHSHNEETLAAWTRFVNTQTLDRRSIRPHVARAWERSVQGGCDPKLMRADTLDTDETQRLLSLQEPLIQCTRPFANALSRAAGRDRHAVMLGDYQGRVLDVTGDTESVQGPESVPGPGSLLDEAFAGANGLGTPLAEGSYVELIGPEHFIEGFHIFTCQGIPLLDAEGAQTGVLGISVRRIGAAVRLRDILFCAAQAVECEMLSQSLSNAVTSMTGTSTGALIDKLRDNLIQRLAFARTRFEMAADAVALGGSAAELLSESESLIRRFRRLADVWRDLVNEGIHATTPVRVDDLVGSIIDLVRTEIRAADIGIYWGEDRATTAITDRHALARSILRGLLSAMQAAGPAGKIQIDIHPDEDSTMVLVVLSATTFDKSNTTSLRISGGKIKS